MDPTNRPTCQELLDDPWLRNVAEHFVQDPQSNSGAAMDLLPQVKKAFDARKTCGCWCIERAIMFFLTNRWFNLFSPIPVRKAVLGMMAMHRMQDGVAQAQSGKDQSEKANHVRQELEEYKKEAETVSCCLPGRFLSLSHTYHHETLSRIRKTSTKS